MSCNLDFTEKVIRFSWWRGAWVITLCSLVDDKLPNPEICCWTLQLIPYSEWATSRNTEESGLRQEMFLQSIQTGCVSISLLSNEYGRQSPSDMELTTPVYSKVQDGWSYTYTPPPPISLHGVALNHSHKLYFHFDSFPKTPYLSLEMSI